MKLIVASSLFLVAVNALAIDTKPLDFKHLLEKAAQSTYKQNPCVLGSIFVIPEKVLREKAAASCAAYDAELANVDNLNFDRVTTLLHGCQGNEARAWIKSWDGTDYGSDCLTLFTGHTVPGGGIDTDCIATAQVPVCQLYPTFDPIFPPIVTDPLSPELVTTYSIYEPSLSLNETVSTESTSAIPSN